ncbi:MAG: RecQ family ATP-dependent DNA helicase [Bacteroidota bacterium]
MNQPLNILKQYWGYDSFRSPQEEIIQSVLDGHDTLALMPTGGGKSICFQVPTLCKEGICIVVSPLIALMKDQVAQLKKWKIAAEAIYSGMHYSQIDRILDNCVYGNTKFLYLSPERLTTDIAKARIAKMKVNLWAVDEAHCISQWGYDFRPPYLQIAEVRELHPKVPVLALTATATDTVERDIQDKLAFENQQVFRNSFARENLAYVVLQEENKEKKLLEIVKNVKGSGVVYVRNRRKTKELALALQKRGVSADFYHAGLDAEERSRKQDNWINNKTRIIVSTNAFGMGIDKSNVRSVVHMDLPDSLEAYFQEAGRGGRDGKKAYAVLLYNQTDKYRLEQSLEQSFPSMKTIRQVYRALGSYYQLAVGGGENKSYDFEIIPFAQIYKLKPVDVFNSLKVLEQAEWLLLSEAIYTPSQFMIKVSKEDLYAYQIQNARFDKILKVILRSTHGAFGNYVKIKEHQLAQALGIDRNELSKALNQMRKDQIIEYLPQKDKPQLTFLMERVDADNLTIDRAVYNFRKEQHRIRIEKAIEYAERLQCRSQQLLSYFDEEDAPECGICDVCLGRHEASVTKDEKESYQLKIKTLLEKESLSLHQLIDSFTPKRRQQVITVIEHLLDENILDKEGEQIVWKG